MGKGRSARSQGPVVAEFGRFVAFLGYDRVDVMLCEVSCLCWLASPSCERRDVYRVGLDYLLGLLAPPPPPL